MKRYQSKAQQFIDDYYVMKTHFPLELNVVLMYGVMAHINAKKPLDVEIIKKIKKTIRAKTSLFSDFRGMSEMLIAIMLSVQNDREAYFDKVVDIHDALANAGFHKSSYLPFVAMIIANNQSERAYDLLIERTKQIYDNMKKRHFWLTGEDDYSYAAILATSPLSLEEIENCSEAYYQALHGAGLAKNNALQSLANILAMSEKPLEETSQLVIDLHRHLKNKGYHIKYHSLPVVGLLAFLGKNPIELANTAIDLSEWLGEHKGFGKFSVDKNLRFALSVAIITDYHKHDYERTIEESVLASTMQSIIIAENIATATAMLAASNNAFMTTI